MVSKAPARIFATRSDSGDLLMNGPPDESSGLYTVPPIPVRLPPYAEWYFLARYTEAGTECVAPPAGYETEALPGDACCGLIREMPIWYAIARGDSAGGFLTCKYSLLETWRVVHSGAEAASMAAAKLRCGEIHQRHAARAHRRK